MFKKVYRLPPSVDFKNSSVYQTPFFTLKLSNNGKQNNRYGFIISKKIDKRAVVRNRTKRKVRFCIEKINDGMKKGYDMLFLIKKNAVTTFADSICLEAESFFRKEGLLL